MLVIDVAGILTFLFWVVVVISVIALIGAMFGAFGERVEEWKKEGGLLYVAFMLIGLIAIAIFYVVIIKQKLKGQ